MKTTRILTGITASGTPHLGNYAGAIRPCIENSRLPNTESYFFIADYHALIKCTDPAKVAQSRMAIAAAWIASGLDPEKVHFYLQSDIPEVTELSWILTCSCPKGVANRAHAYKACVDKNTEKGLDVDEGVSMGLYSYPILMAADILMFNANLVPVGRDQIQHIEMARDLAQRFNFHYGQGKEIFAYPQEYIEDKVATLPGLDGRKMSKSYQNTIPLFDGTDKDLKEAIFRIQTDSKQPGEPKDPDNSALYLIYKAFANETQGNAFKQALIDGLGWGDAKQALYELLSEHLSPKREIYQDLIKKPQQLEDMLKIGADRLRPQAQETLRIVKDLVGLSKFSVPMVDNQKTTKKIKVGKFIQFREKDGLFYARLQSGQGDNLLLSKGFDNPKHLGQLIRTVSETFEESMIQNTAEGLALCVQDEIMAILTSDADKPLISKTLEELKKSKTENA